MSLDITGITNNGLLGNPQAANRRPSVAATQRGSPEKPRRKAPDVEQLRQDTQRLESISGFFNRRLKFTINTELDQVVVKVIDANTDKVIKVLPPEELQRLHLRIREAIGLLFDEKI
jgi:flagellar protein FlaG